MNKLKIYFYVAYPYYFPHFIPIGKAFEARGHDAIYILSQKQNSKNMEDIAKANGLKFKKGYQYLFDEPADVTFFANAFEKANELKSLTVFLEHGIGTKSVSFYHSIEYFDIYLVEGEQKYNRLKSLYPSYEYKLAKVGFSKLDAVVDFSDADKTALLAQYGLDKTKKTILYAPTFFPSSIEKMADDFPAEFAHCNLWVKPHYLSYGRRRYKKQIEKLRRWEYYSNCTILPLSEYNIVPFLITSDVMISDESSAMFEFASLDKPVISNQYFKLRWSYYLMPWKLSRRIDSSKSTYRNALSTAKHYQETITYTQQALQDASALQSSRQALSTALCGNIDGKVSERIYNVVINNLSTS